ncbi:Xanthine phosphoribosyltransferase [Candidatus Lokiarchaeum ossiferum]|uniref:Xanthine phosphoribosyltransferase n=1 Tax=Candidatus Lokiarchaeum ossiferum TaxID=2951803 RepID=A0ABY6HR51_9ARCH|nr:Xanthine phosphoribosyltransferase [Candidatus Lokiarchaeum sp. B-35]
MSLDHEVKEGEYYFTYTQMHRLVQKLAEEIKKDGFNPDFMIAIGTGGFIPARMLKIYINKKVLTVGLSYYDDDNNPMEHLQKIQWLENDQEKLRGKKVLLVDEVNDSGSTLEYTLKELLACDPEEIAVVVLHDKEKEKKGHIPPEIKKYYVGEKTGPGWIHYPWEAEDIDYQNYMAAKFVRKAGRYIFEH